MKKIYLVIYLLNLSLFSFAQDVIDGDKTYNGRIIYKNDITLEKSFHLGADSAQVAPDYNQFIRFSIVYDPSKPQFQGFVGTTFTLNDQSISLSKFGGGEPRLQLMYLNGTIQNPLNVNPGNMLGRTIFYGYFNGNKRLSEISSSVVSTSGTLPSAKLDFSIRKEGNTNPFALDAFLELHPDGNIYLPQMPPTISGANEILSRNIQTGAIEKSNVLNINNDGNVGIGTTTPDEKLTVKGKIHAEEIKVNLSVPGPDYVFAKDYNLTPLREIQKYIKENKHLPEVPSAKEMEEKGINLSEMNMLLLKKVEELTLHLMKQEEKIDCQQKEIEELKNKL